MVPFPYTCSRGGRIQWSLVWLENGLSNSLGKLNEWKERRCVMKKRIVQVWLVTLSVLFLASAATAGPWKGWRGSGGWGPGNPYNQMYDPAALETLSGQVVSIDKTVPMRGMNYGIAMTLKTEKETVSVHLGPGWYIERLDKPFAVGDMVEIKGVRVTFSGKPAVIASEVKKGEKVLVLRDSNGVPVWAGWGGRWR